MSRQKLYIYLAKEYKIHNRIAYFMTAEYYNMNQVIYLESDPVEWLYIIKDGVFEYFSTIDLKEIKYIQIFSGIFGLEETFQKVNKRMVSVRCLSSKAKVYKIKI